MSPIDYYTSLSTEERAAYAKRAGCSIHHYQLNFFRVNGGPKKIPRQELLINLCRESEGNVSLDDAIDYFYIQPIKALAAIKASESRNKAERKNTKLQTSNFNDSHAVAL